VLAAAVLALRLLRPGRPAPGTVVADEAA
jgi:hypothetical protein